MEKGIKEVGKDIKAGRMPRKEGKKEGCKRREERGRMNRYEPWGGICIGGGYGGREEAGRQPTFRSRSASIFSASTRFLSSFKDFGRVFRKERRKEGRIPRKGG